MAKKCEHCGLTTHQRDAEKCLLCGEPFPESSTSAGHGQGSSPQTSMGAPADPKLTAAKPQRSWIARTIHRRAKGGIFAGILLIGIGFYGGTHTRGDVTIGGVQLIGVGLCVLLFSISLVTATRAPRA